MCLAGGSSAARLLLLTPVGLLVVLCLKLALFWVGVAVRLGGPLKRPVRRNAADAQEEKGSLV